MQPWTEGWGPPLFPPMKPTKGYGKGWNFPPTPIVAGKDRVAVDKARLPNTTCCNGSTMRHLLVSSYQALIHMRTHSLRHSNNGWSPNILGPLAYSVHYLGSSGVWTTNIWSGAMPLVPSSLTFVAPMNILNTTDINNITDTCWQVTKQTNLTSLYSINHNFQ